MHPDERREQIVRVAGHHFAHAGYDRASMSRIATDAGVTRALLYHYFPGKEALLEAVLRHEGAALLAATALDETISARANLERTLHAYLAHFTASTGEMRGLYTPHPTVPAVIWEIAAANHTIQIARLIEGLSLDDTPRVRHALGAWLALVEHAARDGAESDVEPDDIVRLCLDTLRAVTGLDLPPDPSTPTKETPA